MAQKQVRRTGKIANAHTRDNRPPEPDGPLLPGAHRPLSTRYASRSTGPHRGAFTFSNITEDTMRISQARLFIAGKNAKIVKLNNFTAEQIASFHRKWRAGEIRRTRAEACGFLAEESQFSYLS